MPAVTQDSPPPVPLAKKRRRDDINDTTATTTATISGHSNAQLAFSLYGSSSSHALRKEMPLPAVKRIRTTGVNEDEPRLTPASVYQTQPNSPILQDQGRAASAPPTTTSLSAPTLTKRCHICGRKPTKKSEIITYADCEGCRQRACFICLRDCRDWRPRVLREGIADFNRQKNRVSLGAMSTDSFTMEDGNDGPEASGPHDQKEEHDSASKTQQSKEAEGWPTAGEHRGMICSKCCIETGEGQYICLGCLPFVG